MRHVGLLSVLIVSLWGCGSQTITLREMTPEEQFAYAKRFFDKGDYDKAKIQFTMVALNNAGSPISDKIQFYLAETHFRLKEYIEAIAEYEKLIRGYPQSPFVDDARLQIGMCYYRLSPAYALDQEYTYKAISQFEQFLEDYPNSERAVEAEKRLQECRQKLAKKGFKTGELYQKMGYYQAAAISYENMAKEFPQSTFAPEALFRMGECYLKMRETGRAIEAFTEVLVQYPSDPAAKKAEARLRALRKS